MALNSDRSRHDNVAAGTLMMDVSVVVVFFVLLPPAACVRFSSFGWLPWRVIRGCSVKGKPRKEAGRRDVGLGKKLCLKGGSTARTPFHTLALYCLFVCLTRGLSCETTH